MPKKLNSSATVKQLSKINVLYAKIRKASEELNSPYIILFNILVVSTILKLINRNLLLGDLLDVSFQEALDDPVVKDLQKLEKSYYYHLEKVHKIFEEAVNNFISQPLMISLFGRSADPLKVLEKLETSTRVSNFKNGLDELKKLAISIIDAHHNSLEEKTFHTKEINSFRLFDLYKKTKEKYALLLEQRSETSENTQRWATLANTAYKLRYYILAAEISFSLLVSYVLIHPMVNRIFPYGIFQDAPDAHPGLLTEKQAKDLIISLEIHYENLNVQARRNTLIARYLSSVLVFFSVVYSLEDISADMLIFFLLVGSVALNNLLGDIKNSYNHYQLSNKLNQQEKFIKSLNENIEIQQNRGNSLESSYFLVSFKDEKKEEVSFSGKQFAGIFKECCLFVGIEIISQQDKKVGLSAQANFNRKKAEELKNLFNQTISRKLEIYKFETQLKNKMASVLKIQKETIDKHLEYDEQHLPVAVFEFDIHESKLPLFEKIKPLFDKCNVEQRDDLPNYFMVTIKGFRFIESLNEKLKEVVAGLPKNMAIPSLLETSNAKLDKLRSSSKDKNSSDDEPSHILAPAPMPTQRRIIRWKSGVFDTNANNKIVPVLRRNQIHSEKACNEARVFIKDGLDWNKVPVVIKKKLEKKIDKLVKEPKFAAKKGEQGLKHWGRYEKDQTGNWFFSSVKGKVLGKEGKGKTRFFMAEEKSPTGEALLLIKGYDLKH